MRSKGIRETQRTVYGSQLHRPQLLVCSNFQVFSIRENCGIACRGRLLMLGVLIGGSLVFEGRVTEIRILKQEVRQLIVDNRRVGFSRKRVQELAIPSLRLCETPEFLIRQVFILVYRVVVICEIGDIRF